MNYHTEFLKTSIIVRSNRLHITLLSSSMLYIVKRKFKFDHYSKTHFVNSAETKGHLRISTFLNKEKTNEKYNQEILKINSKKVCRLVSQIKLNL